MRDCYPQAFPTGMGPQGKPMRDYVSQLARDYLGVPLDGNFGVSAVAAVPQTETPPIEAEEFCLLLK